MEFSRNHLKTKAYYIGCEMHKPRHSDFKVLVKTSRPNLIKSGALKLSKKIWHGDILQELSTESLQGYASLFFFIEYKCGCDMNKLLTRLYRILNENDSLKYITKFVLAKSSIDLVYQPNKFDVACVDGEQRVFVELPAAEVIRARLQGESVERAAKNMLYANKLKMQEFLKRLEANQFVQIPCVNNLILIHWKVLDYPFRMFLFGTLLLDHLSKHIHEKSVQEITVDLRKWFSTVGSLGEITNFSTTSSDGCYVFSINPALAIIINHLSFTDENLELRNGSINDIKKLKQTFVHKKINYLVLSDGNAEDVKKIMSKLQETNLSSLKYLFVFAMSHGKEGDIINTKTKTYNIQEDIIGPLRANPSLEHVQKIVLVNACRGTFDPRFDDNDIEKQPAAEIKDDETLVKIYSTQNGYVSLRTPDGSIVVQKFCDVFKRPDYELVMKDIADEVELQLLKEWEDFKESGMIEYCAKPDKRHSFKMDLEKFKQLDGFFRVFRKFVDENNATAEKDKNILPKL